MQVVCKICNKLWNKFWTSSTSSGLVAAVKDSLSALAGRRIRSRSRTEKGKVLKLAVRRYCTDFGATDDKGKRKREVPKGSPAARFFESRLFLRRASGTELSSWPSELLVLTCRFAERQRKSAWQNKHNPRTASTNCIHASLFCSFVCRGRLLPRTTTGLLTRLRSLATALEFGT